MFTNDPFMNEFILLGMNVSEHSLFPNELNDE